ncbi:MAG: AAA family ATPase [Nitrospirae bacterium]|nr:AAA family ATPase [Nitrospirota bacterium]
MSLRDILGREYAAGTFLFHGPKGAGKFDAALALAKAANCLEERDAASSVGFPGGCGRCLSCRKIGAGVHPDVRVVHPEEGEIRIDRIREIQRDMAYQPLEGRKKVYLLTEADRMNLQTANAFLKALEEPPDGVFVILITEEPHTLLPTLLSRCRKVAFHGTGSGDSGVETRSPISREDLLTALAGGFGGMKGILDAAERIAKAEEATEEVLHWIEVALRDLLVWRETGDPSLLMGSREGIPGEEAPFDSESVFFLMEEVRRIRRGMERNVNKRLALESLFMRFEQRRRGAEYP